MLRTNKKGSSSPKKKEGKGTKKKLKKNNSFLKRMSNSLKRGSDKQFNRLSMSEKNLIHTVSGKNKFKQEQNKAMRFSKETGEGIDLDKILETNQNLKKITTSYIIENYCPEEQRSSCRTIFINRFSESGLRAGVGQTDLFKSMNDLFWFYYRTLKFLQIDEEYEKYRKQLMQVEEKSNRNAEDRNAIEQVVNDYYKAYQENMYDKVYAFTLKTYKYTDEEFFQKIDGEKKNMEAANTSTNNTSSTEKSYLKKYNEFFKNTFYIKLRF